MATPRCEADQLLIILLGSFNPAILQPRWMASINLLGPEESESAKLTVIAPDASIFEVGDWLGMQVTFDRFQVAGPFSHALKIRDLVEGLFSVLEHTPVTQLGVHRAMHFRLQDSAARDALGARFAPPGAWPSLLAAPKLGSLRMQGKRPNSSALTTVTIEPSARIPDVGVFISSHEHHQLAAPDQPAPAKADRAVEVLHTNFDASVRFARELAESLVASASGAGQ